MFHHQRRTQIIGFTLYQIRSRNSPRKILTTKSTLVFTCFLIFKVILYCTIAQRIIFFFLNSFKVVSLFEPRGALLTFEQSQVLLHMSLSWCPWKKWAKKGKRKVGLTRNIFFTLQQHFQSYLQVPSHCSPIPTDQHPEKGNKRANQTIRHK